MICPECNGRGAYDDPPWGIVLCPRCAGSGVLFKCLSTKEQQ